MVFLLIVFVISIINIGCTNEGNEKIAYISSNPNSEHEKTFEELHLGILFDFNLKLPKADKSWVNLWVEGYSEGKALEPFHLAELSYGLSPNKTEEGRTGFGMINPISEEPQFFLYSVGVSQESHGIENNFLEKDSISTWDYAIESKTIGLEPGEEKVLAVYRQDEDTMRSSYDYQNQDSINEMIKEDKTVLLLKIKVEERNEV